MVLCFVCNHQIRGKPTVRAITADGQTVYVGSECYKLIRKAGAAGYQPPETPRGQRLFDLRGNFVENDLAKDS